MKRFSDILKKVEDGFGFLAPAAIFALMTITVIDVSGRYLLNHPLKGSVELSELMLLVLVWVAVAGTQRVGGHVGMEALLEKFKKMNRPLYPAFRIFALFVTEISLVIVFYYAIRVFQQAVSINETTAGPLYIATWPILGLVCFGLLLICVRVAIQFTESIRSIGTWGV